MLRLGYSSPLVGALLAVVTATPASAATLTESERAALCAEAETRYRDIFGRASKDEPFAVVIMYRDSFCPQNLIVKRNTRLRWVNVDKRTSHSVWFKDAGKAESDRAFPEEFVEMVIDWPPGDYPYLCGPHWEREGMIGRLTVLGD
jgi:plastocyanin